MFSFIFWSQVYDIVCVCYVGVGERGVWRELVLPLKQLPIFCVHTFSLFSICFFLSKHVFQTNLLIVYFPGKYTMTGESIDIYSGYVLFWGCLKPRLGCVIGSSWSGVSTWRDARKRPRSCGPSWIPWTQAGVSLESVSHY